MSRDLGCTYARSGLRVCTTQVACMHDPGCALTEGGFPCAGVGTWELACGRKITMAWGVGGVALP